MTLQYLELDLDVFAGPFDLLLTLVLREEVDLLEVDLAEVVIAYIDHLDASGELDLEAATEFLVLIAALLELKSRLLLPGEEIDEVELDPGEAAEELLARLLDAQRYRSAAAHLHARLGEESGYRFRSAPLPPQLRRAPERDAVAVYDPGLLAAAIGHLTTIPPPVDVRHITVATVTVAERLRHLRRLLAAGRFTFAEALGRADRVTIAVTLYALLELHKQGEATWVQDEPFAEITVSRPPEAEPALRAPEAEPAPAIRVPVSAA
ncbi:MAG: segregation/condensation protein A [Solirubrobacterales bacterium]|nr:segregation/condensation protein A [Solirubrobacterales bacterium]